MRRKFSKIVIISIQEGGNSPFIHFYLDGFPKIFTWRANGDGVGSSGNQVVEDCFVRTQDDSSYAGGRGMRRVVFWQDSNGASFVLNHIGNKFFISPDLPLLISDCTVVYARSKVTT